MLQCPSLRFGLVPIFITIVCINMRNGLYRVGASFDVEWGKLCALKVEAKDFLVFSKSIVEFLKLLRSVEIIAEIQPREHKYV